MKIDINTPGKMVAAAKLQGIELSAAEADVILDCLEGHDYYLMMDPDGRTVRHDMQYEDDHREDVPYTIQDAVWFCLEMLEDIWDHARICIVPDTDYLSELRRNKTLLSDLLVREWMPES